jgi:hypothetical protein
VARRRAAACSAQTYIALGQVLLERGSVLRPKRLSATHAVQAEEPTADLVLYARIWQAAARTMLVN